MPHQPLPATFHAANRAALAASIGDDAIAIIDTADIVTRTGDADYPFRPDSNFYYLTGIDQPEATLVLVPGHSDPELRQLLFIKPTTAQAAQWIGEGLTQDQATRQSGITTVFWATELPELLDRLLPKYQTLYLNAAESLTSVKTSPALRRARYYRRQLPLHQYKSALPLLAAQRAIKAPAEIDQIRAAIAITAAGLAAAGAALCSGSRAPSQTDPRESDLAAELTASYIRSGATHAFNPIVAAGRNATIIHYMANSATIGQHDLVLLDTGAEVGYYAADISRTYPAAGRFTARQRAIYQAVYDAQAAAIKLHKPGATILDLDAVMRRHLSASLPKLGLKQPLNHYYPHISHHLGLDVHDTGSARAALQPGMVVTCEPGLYIPEEGIGVRLEDDILITATGHELLSAAVPSAPDAIEALLQKK